VKRGRGRGQRPLCTANGKSQACKLMAASMRTCALFPTPYACCHRRPAEGQLARPLAHPGPHHTPACMHAHSPMCTLPCHMPAATGGRLKGNWPALWRALALDHTTHQPACMPMRPCALPLVTCPLPQAAG